VRGTAEPHWKHAPAFVAPPFHVTLTEAIIPLPISRTRARPRCRERWIHALNVALKAIPLAGFA